MAKKVATKKSAAKKISVKKTVKPAVKKWVYLFEEVGKAEKYHRLVGRRPVPARWQGFRTGRYDACRRSGSSWIHGHHGSVQRIPQSREIPQGSMGAATGCDENCRKAVRQEIWRSVQSAAGFLPFRRKVLHAGHDEYNPEYRPER